MRGALAIFAKTPGVSPVKTRLAESIGKDQAERFYRKCLQTIEAVAAETLRITQGFITPFWAIGEPHTLPNPMWERFTSIYTGPGGLGERMHHIYSMLLQDYDFVLLIGSDSPQITPDLITEAAAQIVESNDYVMGPALDGGFYLLGGAKEISLDQFAAVTYSEAATGIQMRQVLEQSGRLRLLPSLIDADQLPDLRILAAELANSPLPAQQGLLTWLRKHTTVVRESHEN